MHTIYPDAIQFNVGTNGSRTMLVQPNPGKGLQFISDFGEDDVTLTLPLEDEDALLAFLVERKNGRNLPKDEPKPMYKSVRQLEIDTPFWVTKQDHLSGQNPYILKEKGVRCIVELPSKGNVSLENSYFSPDAVVVVNPTQIQ